VSTAPRIFPDLLSHWMNASTQSHERTAHDT
jgi:hypothetical protein